MDQMIDLSTLTTLESVIKAYDSLCVEEKSVEKQINELLSDDKSMDTSMARLRKDMPNMSLIESDAKQLSSLIQFTSSLADSVSYKVRRLDLARTRVAQCLHHIQDILDLKFCTDGIQKALNNEDYEQAAAHIHRFLSMDETLLRKSAAADLLNNSSSKGYEMNASSMDEALARLHEADIKLKDIVMKRFDEAVSDDDVGSVQRFFKIFPLLNQHSDGLKKFSNYLCTKVNDKYLSENNANKSSVKDKHSDKLTQLYESIAKIIDVHQPLIETYYGPGKLVTVIEVIQEVCDRITKKILEDFIAKKNLSQIVSFVTKSLKSSSSYQSTTKVDPRDLDPLLSEIIVVNNRSEMYLRFITKRAKNDIEIGFPEMSDKDEDRTERTKKLNQIEALIRDCQLSHSIHEMNGIYVLIEEYFIHESALKAIQMDKIESSSGSLTSSMLDDVFFIVKKCIKRALSGGSMDVVCAMVNHSVSLLETSFCEAINERIRYGYPMSVSGAAASFDLMQAYNALHAGRYLQTADLEKAKLLFLSSLNNLDTACDYVKTLKTTISEDVKKTVVGDKQNQKLDSCLSDLVALSVRFKSIGTSGLGQLCSSALKPVIKTWIDAFITSNHILSEEDLISYESTEGLRPFTQTFIISIDTLLKSLRDSLTQNNSDTLLSLFTTELTNRLGDALLKCSYNKLGGFQFDRELRSIVNYLTGATTWSIRDKFSKLKNISIILNLETIEEINEYINQSSNQSTGTNPWRLSTAEVKQALRLRQDFNALDIKKLGLK